MFIMISAIKTNGAGYWQKKSNRIERRKEFEDNGGS